jgi:hypothetical protein
LQARAFFDANRETFIKMGADPEKDSLENESPSGGVLPVRHDDGADYVATQEDEQNDLPASSTELGVEAFRRPVAVIGISAK